LRGAKNGFGGLVDDDADLRSAATDAGSAPPTTNSK
jgi:hypothetical protein